jgi:hypothetical protein
LADLAVPEAAAAGPGRRGRLRHRIDLPGPTLRLIHGDAVDLRQPGAPSPATGHDAEQIRQARAILSRPEETVASAAWPLGVSRSTLSKYLPEPTSAQVRSLQRQQPHGGVLVLLADSGDIAAQVDGVLDLL